MTEAQDIKAMAIRLYNEVTHSDTLNRRDLLQDFARIAGGAAAGAALLASVEAQADASPQIAVDDERLNTGWVEWQGFSGRTVRGYAAVPADQAAVLPTIFVVHENRGLNAHIMDVTRRMALEGFRAVAPDFLSPLGGTPAPGQGETAEEASDRARTMIGQLNPAESLADAAAGIGAFATAPLLGLAGTGSAGIVGFCWGGGLVNRMTLDAPPQLAEAVSYYGMFPADAADVPDRRHPRLTIHLAGNDSRVNAGWPAFEQMLKRAGVAYQLFNYPGTEHAFNNDSSAARYDSEAANLAWRRTLTAFRGLMKA